MGGLSLDQLLALSKHDDLSEDDIEDIYAGLDDIHDGVVDTLDKDSMWLLFSLAQHIMRAKQDQLSVAVEEIEKLAEVAGENEELKERNSKLEKLASKNKSKSADGRGVDVRAELEDVQTARNQLKKDLKLKQRQLDDEKRESEKLTTRLESVESERRDLRRQLEQLSENMDEIRRGYESRSDPDDTGERQYAELVRQKNQYINALLDDVEAHDREAASLKSQVTSLGDQLAAATQQIETMTAEFDELRRQWRSAAAAPQPQPDTNTDAALEVDARRRMETQVSELQAAKARRDRQFDQLSAIVEQRTDEFKRLISSRDAEIEALQTQLKQSRTQAGADGAGDRARLRELQTLCQHQRSQLASQQAELKRATAEMGATAALLEKSRAATVNGDDPARTTLLGVKSELARAQSQVHQLTGQLENTEKQAADYNDQVTELTSRLREVTEGEFGLAEAVAEIKERTRQLAVRDRQVAEQNQYINLVQRHLTELADENTALRSRLGMEPHEAAQLTDSQAGSEKLVHVLEREVEKLEEERIALKLENRKLSRQLRSGGSTGLTPDEIRDICRQRKEFWDYVKRLGPAAVTVDRGRTPDADMFERLANHETELAAVRERLSQSERATAEALAENEKMRQGMREILQSVREQDAVSAVKLAAPSLEALLQAMDTRGLVGAYHPALVPYSILQQMEGKNDELRDQLRVARSELRLRAPTSNTAVAPGTVDTAVLETLAAGTLQLPQHVTSCSGQLIGQLTSQLIVALKALDQHRTDSDGMRTELESLRQKFALVRHQTALLYRQLADDADRWQMERRQLTDRAEQTAAENEIVKAQLQALETGALALQAPEDEQRTAVCEAHRQMAVGVSELLRCERRLRLLTAERDELADRRKRAETDVQQAQMATTDRIAALTADKNQLEFQLSVLQRELEASAPLVAVTELNDKVDRLSALYTTLIAAQQKLLGEERTSRLLEAEVEHLRSQLATMQSQDLAAVQNSGSEPAQDDLTTLRVRLADVTSREQQQRQRADHAHKMTQMLRDQLRSAECHAEQLETRAAELAEAGAAGRLALARLADQLTAPSATQTQDAHKLTQKLTTLEGERDRLARTLDIATSQLEHVRAQRDAADAATGALRQLWAEAQHSDDRRAVIASLHHRLLASERSESELQHELTAARAALQSAEARIYRAETEAANARLQMSGLRTSHAKKIRTVRCVVQELRGCLSLPQRALQERLSQSLTELLTQRQSLQRLVTDAQAARDVAEGERGGVQAQRVLLDEALQQLKSGGVELKAWLERCQNAEIQVTSLRLRAERLATECEHVRNQLSAEERRATDAENTMCRLKNELELRHVDHQLISSSPVSPRVASAEPSTPTERPTAAARAADGQQQPVAHRRSQLPVPSTDRHRPADDPTQDGTVKTVYSRHSSLLRRLMTSHLMTSSKDVSALEARVSAALEGPSPALQLLAVSSDVIQHLCDVTGDRGVGRAQDGPVQTREERPRPLPRRGTWTEESLAPSIAGLAISAAPPTDPSTTATSIPPPPDPSALPLYLAEVVPSAAELSRHRRLLVAETTVRTLRQRLQQKEATLAEYRRLLDKAREAAAQMADKQEAERARETDQLRQQLAIAASIETERSAAESEPEPAISAELSGTQLSRLHESNELLAEQERAIGALMERLRQSREQEARHRERVQRLERERRDTAEVLGRTVSAIAAKRSQLRDQLMLERRQAATQAQTRLRAQAEAQQALIARLREILLKKEKQHHALAKVLREIKVDILRTVEEVSVQQQQQQQADSEKAERPDAADEGDTARSGVDAADPLPNQLAAAERELDAVKNELNERTLQCHRLQAELHEADRRRREDTQRLQRHLDQARSRLRAAEQAHTSARAKPQSDPQKIQEELAKWEERKRWQRSADKLRARLREKETESERHQAQAAALRDTIHRLEREKAAYEVKIRTLTGMMSDERYHNLERENDTLRAEVAQLRGSETGEQAATVDRLRQQVQTLTTRLAEQRAAVRRGKSSATNVAKFEAELRQLRAANTQLESENAHLKQQVAELRCSGADAAVSSDRAAGSGDADGRAPAAAAHPDGGMPAAPPAADPGTVVILRRLVERLRAENLRLRRELIRHTVTSTSEQQVDLLKQELHRAVADRDHLAAQLQRMHDLEMRAH